MSLFSDKLISWYEQNKRDLPWRHTNNPYHIWISEIMLQQTQAITVIPYYNRFINTVKDIKALAEIEDEKLLKLWEGLGYYQRARNLKIAAISMVELHNGEFPNQYEDIIKLKGIGDYTAGAIMSIAFNQGKSALDGNVSRVLSRYFLIDSDISKPKTKALLNSLNEKLIDYQNAHTYTQAIIELGATMCVKSNPNCVLCPVNQDCLAFKENKVNQLPVKSKLKPKVEKHFITAIIRHDDDYLVEKVTDNLLNGLYLLPQIEAESIETALDYFDSIGLQIVHAEKRDTYKHVFTHLIWHMDVYYLTATGHTNYYKVKNFEDIPMATAHKQIIVKEINNT